MHTHIVAASASALNHVRGRGILSRIHHTSHSSITSRGFFSPFHKLVLITVASKITRGRYTSMIVLIEMIVVVVVVVGNNSCDSNISGLKIQELWE